MINNTKLILVAASMSAGKSSLINALLGKEILPVGNEATSSKVARITVTAKKSPLAKAYSLSGTIAESSKTINSEKIREWNTSDKITAFEVIIPHSGSRLHSMLAGYTLIDTPGSNNSRNTSHKEIFINTVKTYPNSLILYVLNATQLATTDDANIIRSIREMNPKQSVVFALNKVDELDEERGETAKDYVVKASHYLEGLGYIKPTIVPLMAQSALIAKKTLSQTEICRRERNILNAELARFRENPFHLNSAATVPNVFKRNVRKRLAKISKGNVQVMSPKELKIFIDYTGLSTVKALITGAA
ncbi:dynamin family protein [Shewanella mangrovi]|uniref:dynamin family protein n=1 Tax=Shewanella mangrovi TaxID=1515746 RepID=UPI00068B98C1|nr:dynamin family protein [Shewanella mangrovi]